ncbi:MULTISPECIES: LysR family transcriptional regulator [Streptomyces]|uniref:LysR family transcriptional regulator n=2 Tax=Streptomyces TaxID=1883 RepID=A0A2U9P6F9_STRAS|nr:LysR family transcriptional regulator [Streptomyces actuosus]AWT44751.1 LysR family transcriptional regulator [Streptomyces actuosus]MBM4821294.1 LysR family transcriptional regulator [Streptomyces actuosus]
MELELRHLKTIRAIADAGSLTRAATALGLAQPALSAQLRRIERALGGALFERGRHGVRTTALGELVLERTRIVLPAVSDLQREAARFARTRRDGERLRLGATHGPLLGALVDRLADAAPGTSVSTCASWSERELAELLAEGRLDFVLTGTCGSAPPPPCPHLVWEEIAVDPVCVMLADGHPLARGREVDLAALADEEWACVPGDGCFADCFTAACARAGFTPRRMYETDTASCVHLVQVGRAVGLCRATFPPTPGLAVRPLTGTPLSWRHLLGWHPSAQHPDTATTVLTETRAAHASAAAASAGHRGADSGAASRTAGRGADSGAAAPARTGAGSITSGQGVG